MVSRYGVLKPDLLIVRADNGWILHMPEADAGSWTEVVEEDRKDVVKGLHEARTTVKMLWRIVNMLVLGGSKHDKERVDIILERVDLAPPHFKASKSRGSIPVICWVNLFSTVDFKVFRSITILRSFLLLR